MKIKKPLGGNALYQEKLLRLSRKKTYFRALRIPDAVADKSNPRCGDEIRVHLKTKKSRGLGINQKVVLIGKVSFTGNACAVCLASANLMCERVEGLGPLAAKEIHGRLKSFLTGELPGPLKNEIEFSVFSGIQTYPGRFPCVLLPWQALELCLKKI